MESRKKRVFLNLISWRKVGGAEHLVALDETHAQHIDKAVLRSETAGDRNSRTIKKPLLAREWHQS